MFDLSIVLPHLAPVVLMISIAPAFRVKRNKGDQTPLFLRANTFNHLLLDQRGITPMECAVVAGSALSFAWVVFMALGSAFNDMADGILA